VTLDGANNFSWVDVDSAGPQGCTSFPTYVFSSNAGSTWTAASNPGYDRGYFNLNVDQHALTGTASWIISGLSSATTWTMSTFTMSENPGGPYGGAITYDVGSGSSSSSATYSSSGLTLAQVRALTNMTGQYFYLRVNFTVASPGYDRAVVGSGSILYN